MSFCAFVQQRSNVALRLLVCALVYCFFITVVPAQGLCVPAPMAPARMVNDFAKMFTQDELQAIEAQVREFHAKTTTQIYVVTVTSLEGMPSLTYATKLGNAWGVGQKGKDNGVVLLIKPKTAAERGEVALALGAGVEKVMSQPSAQQLINNSLLPLFKKGLFAEGVQQAVYTLEMVLADKFTTPIPSGSSMPAGINNEQADVVNHAAPNASSVVPLPTQQQPTSTTSVLGGIDDSTMVLIGLGLFASVLIVLVVTGHADIAGKILLGLFALIGAIFAIGAFFGKGGGGSSSGGSSYSGGGYSGGGGGSFSGGGASGSW